MPDTDATELGSLQDDLWATPQARDFRSGDDPNGIRATRKREQGWSQNLNDQVKMWPTPTANEDACGKATGKMQAMLGNHPDLGKDKTAGSLNPQFCEWLMGYPKDWTAVEDFASGRKKTMKPQGSPPE
jgi:hypothetical protein